MSGTLQNEDHKTEAQLVLAGGSKTQLLNDTKLYSTVLAQTLDDAFTMNLLQAPGVLGTYAVPIIVLTATPQIDLAAVNTKDKIVVFIKGDAANVDLLTAQILNPQAAGKTLILVGTDDLAKVTLTDNVNGPMEFGASKIATYLSIGTSYVEQGRNS